MTVLFFNKHNYSIKDGDIDQLKSIFLAFKEALNIDLTKEVELEIVNPEEIREINKQYRNIDKTTDVLSFSFVNEDVTLKLMGCIYISYEKIEGFSSNSFTYNFSFLFVHGLLHIQGYDHGEKMSFLEKDILSNFFKI